MVRVNSQKIHPAVQLQNLFTKNQEINKEERIKMKIKEKIKKIAEEDKKSTKLKQ